MAEHGKHLTDEERLSLYRALAGERKSLAKIAKDIGVHDHTAREAKYKLLQAGYEALAGADAKKPKETKPDHIHDVKFWRHKAANLTRERNELSAILRELGGLDGLQIGDPTWLRDASSGVKGKASLVVHNSDRHLGEVIAPSEINNWNKYDVAICQKRVRTFITAACELGRRWTSDTTVEGVFYTMGGDEISGDIHEELRETNEVTSLEQVQLAAELHVWCIRTLLEEYGRVHVAAVPGNHGRTTRKPTAKKYGALSYDILIAKLVAQKFEGVERVSFDIAEGPDSTTIIYNRPVLLSHGDKFGTGGGQGFAGPVLPIIRGANKVKLQYGQAGWTPYLILMGHYHTSAAPPGILANGSVPGMSEYGFGIRGAYDTPKQWLAVMRSRWGLTERLDVQLEEPLQPEKPRIRMAT